MVFARLPSDITEAASRCCYNDTEMKPLEQVMTRIKQAILLVLGVLCAAVVMAQDSAGGDVVAIYTLPDTPVADVYPAVQNRDVLLGGIGSDIWFDRDTTSYWLITDRGPLSIIFQFTPLILHVTLEGEEIVIQDVLPLVNADGAPVTGLPIPGGIDSEGLVRTPDGRFWVADEYAPSLVSVSAQGQVITRYVPDGQNTTADTVGALPAILAARRDNRGFEGLALSPDGTTLFAAMQSPLHRPDGADSRAVRIIAFDIASERVTAEYVYWFDDPADYGMAGRPEAMMISGLDALDADTLLVLERTDAAAKLYKVELADATNILGTAWDDPATTPSLEALPDLTAAGIVALPKTLAVDVSLMGGIVPPKIEGIAVIDDETLVIANDNDFDASTPSQMLVIKTTQPLGVEAAHAP